MKTKPMTCKKCRKSMRIWALDARKLELTKNNPSDYCKMHQWVDEKEREMCNKLAKAIRKHRFGICNGRFVS